MKQRCGIPVFSFMPSFGNHGDWCLAVCGTVLPSWIKSPGSFFLVQMNCPDNGLRNWCQIFCQTQVWIVVTSLGQEKYKHFESIGDWTFCTLQRSFVMQKQLRDYFDVCQRVFGSATTQLIIFFVPTSWSELCVVYRCSAIGFLNYEWVPYSCHYMHLNGKRLNILPWHCSCSSWPSALLLGA